MKDEFECLICGDTATASVDDEETADDDKSLETLHDCSNCGIETIWVEA